MNCLGRSEFSVPVNTMTLAQEVIALVIATYLLAPVAAQEAMEATGGLSGQVLELPSSLPVAGAQVILLPILGATNRSLATPLQVITDWDGRFAFEALSAGRYRLRVQKRGLVRTEPSFVNSPTWIVRPGLLSAGIQIFLGKSGVIAGRVTDENGAPMRNLIVIAVRMSEQSVTTFGGGSLSGRTNAVGEYRIAGISTGEYQIRAMVMHAGPADSTTESWAAPTFYPGTANPLAAKVVTVAIGEILNNVDFPMVTRKRYRVSGIVVDEGGRPISDALVTLAGAPLSVTGPNGMARTLADGTFTVDGVPSGIYRARLVSIAPNWISEPGSKRAAVPKVGRRIVSMSHEPVIVTVSDGDVQGVRVIGVGR